MAVGVQYNVTQVDLVPSQLSPQQMHEFLCAPIDCPVVQYSNDVNGHLPHSATIQTQELFWRPQGKEGTCTRWAFINALGSIGVHLPIPDIINLLKDGPSDKRFTANVVQELRRILIGRNIDALISHNHIDLQQPDFENGLKTNNVTEIVKFLNTHSVSHISLGQRLQQYVSSTSAIILNVTNHRWLGFGRAILSENIKDIGGLSTHSIAVAGWRSRNSLFEALVLDSAKGIFWVNTHHLALSLISNTMYVVSRG